jgi:hypothetical protein
MGGRLYRKDDKPMTDLIPKNPNTWLRRGPAAKALTAAGYPISEATLACAGRRGDGPPFRINCRAAEYQWGPTLQWRISRVRYRGGSNPSEEAA